MKKALIYAVKLAEDNEYDLNDSIEELENLANSLEFQVVGKIVQKRNSLDPRHYVGTGKLEELRAFLETNGIEYFISNNDLTPIMNKNLSRILGIRVLDRREIILEIFSDHAKTKVAKTQVEIARLEFILPRLTKNWTHLDRQKGGIGLKGTGEKQIELDKRLIKDRITKLRKELINIEKSCEVRRKLRSNLFKVALVGYTNSGKSTLLNSLTESNVLTMDKLFSTLDSSTRIMSYEKKPTILLTDTVGFIDQLPHSLIASFKSTLDEVVDADLLIIVTDISHPMLKRHIEVTSKVVDELGCQEKPRIYVFNKTDKIEDPTVANFISRHYEPHALISAKKKENTSHLKEMIYNYFEKNLTEWNITLKYSDNDVISRISKETFLQKIEYKEENIEVWFKAKENFTLKPEKTENLPNL